MQMAKVKIWSSSSLLGLVEHSYIFGICLISWRNLLCPVAFWAKSSLLSWSFLWGTLLPCDHRKCPRESLLKHTWLLLLRHTSSKAMRSFFCKARYSAPWTERLVSGSSWHRQGLMVIIHPSDMIGLGSSILRGCAPGRSKILRCWESFVLLVSNQSPLLDYLLMHSWLLRQLLHFDFVGPKQILPDQSCLPIGSSTWGISASLSPLLRNIP